jgi:hypothetical protein
MLVKGWCAVGKHLFIELINSEYAINSIKVIDISKSSFSSHHIDLWATWILLEIECNLSICAFRESRTSSHLERLPTDQEAFIQNINDIIWRVTTDTKMESLLTKHFNFRDESTASEGRWQYWCPHFTINFWKIMWLSAYSEFTDSINEVEISESSFYSHQIDSWTTWILSGIECNVSIWKFARCFSLAITDFTMWSGITLKKNHPGKFWTSWFREWISRAEFSRAFETVPIRYSDISDHLGTSHQISPGMSS